MKLNFLGNHGTRAPPLCMLLCMSLQRLRSHLLCFPVDGALFRISRFTLSYRVFCSYSTVSFTPVLPNSGSPISSLLETAVELTVVSGSTLKTYGRLHCQSGYEAQRSRETATLPITNECSLLGIDFVK